MTRDDIIRMAREAGFESHDAIINYPKELQRFAAIVAASEREECAKIAFNAKTYMQAAHEIRERGAP